MTNLMFLRTGQQCWEVEFRVWYQPQHSVIDFTLTILVIMDKQLAHV